MAQYKVPQNIDIEDKVIGPLTIRQFLIILVATGIIAVLNFVFIGPLRVFFLIFAFVIGASALGLAFFKYGDQNAEVFLLSAYKTFINPRKRIWQKEEIKEQKEQKKPEKPKDEEKPETRADIETARSSLEKLAEVVDSGGYSNLKEDPTIEETPDLIATAEKASPNVDRIIEDAAQNTPQREKLVSEMASVEPDEKLKETPHIILRGKNQRK